jgi:hypothetical protein
MAGTALALKVIGGLVFGMAAGAIGEAGVIEGRWLPGLGRMTIAADTREVIGRRILDVAAIAVGETRVIERGGLPGFRGVTLAAFAGIVIDGCIYLMAVLTVGGVLMVKYGGLKRHVGVAALTRQAHRLELAVVLILVAAHTLRRQPFGLAADVTLIAVDLGMLAREGRAVFGREIGWQRDRAGGDLNPA